ncbi:MAG: hypothetical protein QXD97_01940 [Acidilobaceae archaeon]
MVRESSSSNILEERNKEKDFINKLVKQITGLIPNAIHILEDLEKEYRIARGKTNIERRKRNARTPWKIIHSKFSEKTLAVKVPPYNTSRTCL